MIHLVFADSSLELVPGDLLGHPAVKKYREKYNRGKHILLDDSYHHSAMKNLEDRERRGRPDIVHFCLLEALGSPLCLEGKLKIFVHTRNNEILTFDSQVRLPRNYMRFKGLMEEVLRDKKSKNDLIVLEENVNLKDFFSEMGCKDIIGLSRVGERIQLGKIFTEELLNTNTAIVIGAFPRGSFSQGIVDLLTKKVSIYPHSLDAWVVASRVLARIEYELKLIQL